MRAVGAVGAVDTLGVLGVMGASSSALRVGLGEAKLNSSISAIFQMGIWFLCSR